MKPQQFIFPPPPPAPPAVPQYPAYTDTGGAHGGYAGNRNRGGRANRGYQRGNNRANSRGGGNFASPHTNSSFNGYPAAGNNNAGYTIQTSSQAGNGYALTDYPPVQLPQYPANLGHEHRSPSALTPSTPFPRLEQASYPTDIQHNAHQRNGQQQYDSRRFDPPTHSIHSVPYPPQDHAPFRSRRGVYSPQPVLMGPPIRMGFDEQREGRQSHQYPHPPVANDASPYQNGTYNSTGLPHPHINTISSHHSRHDSPNPFPGHRGGQKRRHGDVFGRARNKGSRGQAAPAVPSFGAPLPLPVKPPVPLDSSRKSKKKRKKNNQLGLTPKLEEHASSEEEDDSDEETKLAAAVTDSMQGSQLLQFEYKGRTSILQSSSDISAWIEERKKLFPTKARIAEMAELKRQRQDAQKAAALERREAQERRKVEAMQRQKEKAQAEQERWQKEKKPKDSEEAAAKAKRKVEKLRKQLEKEERRAAKAEAKASRQKFGAVNEDLSENTGERKNIQAHDEHPSLTDPANTTMESFGEPSVKIEPIINTKSISSDVAIHDFALNGSQEQVPEAGSMAPDPLTPTSQPPSLEEPRDALPPQLEGGDAHNEHALREVLDRHQLDEAPASMIDRASASSSASMSDSSLEMSTDSEDSTSSSGSSSSSSFSDENGPEQASSRRNGPEKIAPPSRNKRKQICRDFLRQGRCKRGQNCRFLHELPEKGSQSKKRKEPRKAEGRTERIGLYQRLVEQEKAKEDHEILQTTMQLGDGGYLNQGISHPAASMNNVG